MPPPSSASNFLGPGLPPSGRLAVPTIQDALRNTGPNESILAQQISCIGMKPKFHTRRALLQAAAAGLAAPAFLNSKGIGPAAFGAVPSPQQIAWK